MNTNILNKLANVLELEPSDLASDFRIDDLGMDSLDFLQFALDLEKEFGVKIHVRLLAACPTIGDTVALVESTLCSHSS
jgi:acyl carrier protein